MDTEFRNRFLENADDTGRHFVYSVRTGKTYAVEPIGYTRTGWGDIDVTTKEKKVTGDYGNKYRGSVAKEDSLITDDNFINIQLLPPGTSPQSAIDALDAKYPDRVE